ncbi:GPI biosynthesis protein family Pig-F-domain-containing protein [Crucibulum laeve]|uniref:GPI biosynthesis protein family Pig-F-domain-containing protein n=1 Tax=Crucibulum laeve TaxID=68775 RepID=A0A5C3LHW9_9AGAR|nr:GPI biosynthesis protein family Pig-F-domain-containing protein [Crucibulum laeve]
MSKPKNRAIFKKTSSLSAPTPIPDARQIPGPGPIDVVGSLPMSSYISVVGVHTTLLTFTALFLPRNSFLAGLTWLEWDPSQLTSRDRPQHPFLEALTMSPTSTLACICLGSIVVQGWWAGWIRDCWLRSVMEGNEDEQKLDKALVDRKKFAEVASAWGATLVSSFVVHATLVLFGAPLLSHVLQTYLLALLLSVLTAFPPAYVFGPPSFGNSTSALVKRLTWIRLFAEFSIRNSIERAIVYPVIGTAVGCWIGIIPIALDWDRPWQAWPLTPAFGAMGGYITASICALTFNTTRQIAIDQMRSQRTSKQKTS